LFGGTVSLCYACVFVMGICPRLHVCLRLWLAQLYLFNAPLSNETCPEYFHAKSEIRFLYSKCVLSITHVVWVKFLLNTDSGNPKDAGITLVQHPGKPYEIPLFLHSLVSVSFLLQTSFLLYAPFLLHTWCVFPIGYMSCTNVPFLLPSTSVSFLWPSTSMSFLLPCHALVCLVYSHPTVCRSLFYCRPLGPCLFYYNPLICLSYCHPLVCLLYGHP